MKKHWLDKPILRNIFWFIVRKHRLRAFTASQEPLSPDMDKILRDNRPDLYENVASGRGHLVWGSTVVYPSDRCPLLPKNQEEGMTIVGNGASELGKLMREQRKNGGPTPHA